MISTLTWIDISAIVGAAAATAALLQVFNKPKTVFAPVKHAKITSTFEFDLSGTLVCTNIEAFDFLQSIKLPDPDWDTLHHALSSRFADLPDTIFACNPPQTRFYPARSVVDPFTLEIEQHANGLTLLMSTREDNMLNHNDVHNELAPLPNLALVKSVSENAPFPVWQSKADGSLGWSNAFYQSLNRRVAHNQDQLFEITETMDANDGAQRIKLRDNTNNRIHWFDVTRQRFEDGYVNFAIDVHAVVKAETAQRNFVQTLAKTFAHLATGLAIFDRNRQLVLFNPSLFDLTDLRPEFLTTRPNLFSFFDQLRDKQIMPEPKSYANWRERIADVITAASDDNFSETWHLPNGLTYRVTGRPHPDGAIAFLFEDISAEISLTRRFRDEADVTHSALDALDQAIAIFNRAGFVQYHNSAMRSLIGQQSDKDLEDMCVRDVTRLCQRTCKPSPVWGEIRNFVIENAERETWSAPLQSKDGQTLALKVSPLASGASLIALTPEAPSGAAPSRIAIPRKRITASNSAVA